MKPVIRSGYLWQPFPGRWVRAWECSTGETTGRGTTPLASYKAWRQQYDKAMIYFMKHRNIGGSVLPSNNSQILKPENNMQVRVIEEFDTHGLFRIDDGKLLARHPNGFSCRELMNRLISKKEPKKQAEYIVMCGGHVTAEGWAACEAE